MKTPSMEQSRILSFCQKVSSISVGKAVRRSFLADLEEVIAKKKSRPGRKELRDRDKPLKVKTRKNRKKVNPFSRKGPAFKKTSDTNIDEFGNLKGLKDRDQGGAEKEQKETLPTPVSQKGKEAEEEQEGEWEEEQEEFPEPKAFPQLTALRSMDDPYIFLVNFRNTDERQPFFQKLKPMLNPRSVMIFYSGRKNDAELSQFYAFLVAGTKRGDFTNTLGNLNHEAQGLPEDFLSQDAPFDGLMFGPDFKKLGVNEAKVKRELNEVLKKMSSSSSQGQVSALRMMSEIPIDYVRFLTPEKSQQREFYLGGNPPNAGTRGTTLVLCDEKESAHFMKFLGVFKPMNTFFNDLYFVSDIDTDFKEFKPFKIVPARALLLEAKKKFETKEDEKKRADQRKKEAKRGEVQVEDKDGNVIGEEKGEFTQLVEFAKENMGNSAKQGSWKKARYYEGDNWIHFNKDHTKAILWGPRTKSISLNKKDILESLPFVKNANLTFLK